MPAGGASGTFPASTGQQWLEQTSHSHRRAKQPAARHKPLEGLAEQAVSPARHLPLHFVTADISETSVFHTRRAGGFAGTACEAAIQMQARLLCRGPFQNLLDQIDASSRAVQLVTKQLVGRTRGGAEAAMHALAQDLLGLAAFRCLTDEIGKMRLHA
jgi:hypothetical protein